MAPFELQPLLDEMIDGCSSVLGIPMTGFDSPPFGKWRDFGFHDRGLTEGAPAGGRTEEGGGGAPPLPQCSSRTHIPETVRDV